MRFLAVVALLSMPLLAACSDGTDPTAGMAITNVTVIDAVNGVREGQTVVFDGDEITSVGPAEEAPSVTETIDGAGKYLIPGLWDMHIHLTATELFHDSLFPLLLSYGVTSVRDPGADLDGLLPLVEAAYAEGSVAPRIYYAGPLLDGEFVVYDGSSPFRPLLGAAITMEEQARQAVANTKAAGASFIKIYEMVTPEIFDALVQAANDEGLPIAAHVPLSTRASQAGARVNSIEHLRNVLLDCASDAEALLEDRRVLLENPDGLIGSDLRSSIHADQRPRALEQYDPRRCDETITALSSTLQVPTLTLNARILKPYFRADWEDALRRIPEPTRSAWRGFADLRAAGDDGTPVPDDDPTVTFSERQLELVRRMYEAGVPIGAGTDTPIPIAVPGYTLHLELAALVHAGLSPMDALAAATLRPAEWFSMEDEMGAIGVGQRADMVLLDADPLLDIENTRAISAVVTKGVVLDRDDIEELIEQSANGEP